MEGFVSYEENNKGMIIGYGTISKILKPTIGDVFLVVGLKHNLMSINQSCDRGNIMILDFSGRGVIKSHQIKLILLSLKEKTLTS